MARHADLIEALRKAVFESAGAVAPALRQAVARNQALPEALRAYVDKVARHAYKVTDEDVAALKRAGYSDDQLFEITVSAAVGAGLSRLEAGLQALRGKT
jgi:alkylhydroperoxidase family enzyme